MIQLELFPLLRCPALSLCLREFGFFSLKLATLANGNSPSLLFLTVSGLGTPGGLGGERGGFSAPVSGASKEVLESLILTLLNPAKGCS